MMGKELVNDEEDLHGRGRPLIADRRRACALQYARRTFFGSRRNDLQTQ